VSDAYLAGFFDGEGCVMTRRGSGGYWELRLSVGQIDPAPLYLLQGRFGGGIYRKSKGLLGRQVWAWVITGDKAAKALEALAPHLIVKRDQALLALEFWSADRETRPELARLVGADKHKAYAAPITGSI
jgi:hypothetical protein